jgi:hypothetical protein
MNQSEQDWFNQLKQFCEIYNIPNNHLHEILADPKVISND